MKRLTYNTGHYYHLYNRGRSRLPLFHEPDDYRAVLEKMKQYSRQFDLKLIAYCLLPNHYHFLVRQEGAVNAGLLPQRVFNSYSKRYNKKYDHSGTLFEGPYKVVEVVDDQYLIYLCHYIHANPVTHGLVAAVEQWPYSNYHEWVEKRPGTLVDIEFVREHFPAAGMYVRSVEEHLEEQKLEAGDGATTSARHGDVGPDR